MNSNTIVPTGLISVTELKNAFFLINKNKYPGNEEIDFNVIRSCFGELYEAVQYLQRYRKVSKRVYFWAT